MTVDERVAVPPVRDVDDGSSDPSAPKIQRTLIGDQVYAIIWKQIVSHKLRPGDKLSDLRLSEELGVSRTPVREALFRLAQDGIVRAESRRGFTVATFSRQDVDEAYDVRTALEVMAVRRAVAHLTDERIDAAQRALDEGRGLVATGNAGARELWLKVDRDFHRMISTASQNQRLVSMLDTLQAQIRAFHVYVTHTRPIQQRVIDQHQVILDALRSRDGKAAEQAMEHHVQSVKRHILTRFVGESEALPSAQGTGNRG